MSVARIARRRMVEASWNVMTHAQKPDFVFRRNGRVHLDRRGRQFSRLLTSEVCASAVVMLDTPCSEVVWRVLATHSIRQFPLHFPSRASPCAITFQLESNVGRVTENGNEMEGRVHAVIWGTYSGPDISVRELRKFTKNAVGLRPVMFPELFRTDRTVVLKSP
jgi:hypothetical protein